MLKFAHISGKDLCHKLLDPSALSQTPSPGLRVEIGQEEDDDEGPGHNSCRENSPPCWAPGLRLVQKQVYLVFCLLCLLGSRIMATALC